MAVTTLILVFLTAVLVSSGVVWAFAAPMDTVLFRLVSGGMAAAWSMYIKFGLFVATFVGGLRLQEIQALAGAGTPPQSPPLPATASQCIVEIFRTIAGSLSVACWTLLAFFGVCLAVYAAESFYDTRNSRMPLRPSRERPKDEEHPASAERRPGAPAGRY